MKFLKLISILSLSFFIINLYSCKSDPSESLGEEVLRDLVKSESNGKITIEKFSKTNGLKREIAGLPNYTMEFTAEIRFVEHLWKSITANETEMFSNFMVMDKIENDTNQHTSPKNKRFYKDAKINIEGEITFEKTDNGWRKTKYTTKKSTIIINPNPLQGMVGAWKVISPDWAQLAAITIDKQPNNTGIDVFEITINDGFDRKIKYLSYEELNDGIKFIYHHTFFNHGMQESKEELEAFVKLESNQKITWNESDKIYEYQKK